MRRETDSIGQIGVPDNVCWGGQTERALINFPISGLPISHHAHLLGAFAMAKIAATRANVELGKMDAAIAASIEEAATEIIAGRWHDQFPRDVIQGGAGSSASMNFNKIMSI